MTLLATAALDVTIVLALALAVVTVLRGRSATLRHWILATALLCAAAVPLLEAALPAWPFPAPWWLSPTAESTLTLTSAPLPAGPIVTEATSAPTPVSRFARPDVVLLALWFAGAVVGLAALLVGLHRLARLARGAQPLVSGRLATIAADAARAHGVRRPVRLLLSADQAFVVTWGLVRPRVLLPATAVEWSDERVQVVLAHELAHVRRGDWSLQLLATLVRSLYWFNPLVWIVSRQLRLESERACDDAVLATGIEGTDYASHLLAVARDAARVCRVWIPATAIAQPSTLEGRIRAMLNTDLNRRPLGRALRCVIIFAFGAVTAVVAGAAMSAATATVVAEKDVVLAADVSQTVTIDQPAISAAPPPRVSRSAPPPARGNAAAAPPQLPPAAFIATLIDQTGAALPGVMVTLTDTLVGITYNAVTDAVGWVSVRELPPGEYQMVATLAGFRRVTNLMTFGAGQTIERTITLPVGALQETITVVCGAEPAASRGQARAPFAAVAASNVPFAPLFTRVAQRARGAQPVRVGGQIKAPQQIRKVNPICPTFVPSGTSVVILEGRIGVDGYLNDVRSLRPDPVAGPLSEVAEAALVAVRQWMYTPTLLNNTPIEVVITVTVQYSRS
jgi:beta-lactamase regulating signal transducer with metallopeptidase domain